MIVTVVGTGYVGLVTGACLASHGHTVRLVDVSPERVAVIRAGKAPFHEPGLEELLRQGQAAGRLSATCDLAAAMEGSQLSLIAVGTPAKGEDPDLSYLRAAACQIGAELRRATPYHVVAVKSTVIPGTTRDLVGKCLERESGLRLGDFGLAMNPEFLREGRAVDDFRDPDRIVIGQADDASGDVLEALYGGFDCEKPRVALEEAELIKYASNALLSVLVSYSNELAALCEATPGVDVETIMQGLHLDRRLSPRVARRRIRPEILGYLRAGIGFGGSCLPKDVDALRVYGKRMGVRTPLLDATMEVNARRPEQVVAIADAAVGGLAGKTVALLGVAFKAGTDDLRSSPALAIWRALEHAGARVRAYDPLVSPEAAASAGLSGPCTGNLEEAVSGADAALITMAEPAFQSADWARLASLMRQPVLIDGRSILRSVPLPEMVRYYPIGRGAERRGA
jgi:UDPglucose 6-dehydrogenase/GDP-mannose 6-dehydrogenase